MSDIGPIPGDPAGIRTEASKYTLTAEALLDAAREIRRLASDSDTGSSDAVEALVNISGDVADRLDKLHSRYETAGSELTAYAEVLETAQTDAATAISMRDSATTEQSNALYWEQYYNNEARSAQDPSEQSDALRYARQYADAAETAAASLAAARELHRSAVSSVETAGNTAAQKIAEAIESDGLNDGWWDNFKGWVRDNAGPRGGARYLSPL